MQHAADAFAFVHQIKSVVDVFQPHGVGDKGGQLDALGHGIFHHAGQFAAALDPAKSTAQPATAGDQLEGAGGNFLPRTGHDDDDALPPAPVGALQRSAHDIDVANALKAVVHAPAGHLHNHLLNGALVVFGVDAIGRARGRSAITGANDERENTLNQLLTEMDGFSTNAGVIILAATNRADILDRALLRAGRFDRQIHVELPDLDERKAIFLVHLKPVKIDDSVDVDFLSKQTPGFSGADIANVCNEAALICARKGKKVVDKTDFMDAIDRIIGGLEKRNKIISQQEKRTVAYHEAGHAAISWLLEHASPLVKVTIVPRGKALGAAWYLPEERQITTFEQMFDEMIATLGGRASEEVNFGVISTGALNDLERVTKQAYAMVMYYGLNKKLGNISFYDSSGQQEYSFTKPYSEKTAQLIDEEVHKLIEQAYNKAVNLLTENKSKVDKLAQLLLDKEVIFSEDLEKIFGKREFARDVEKRIEYEEEKRRLREKLHHIKNENSKQEEIKKTVEKNDVDTKSEDQSNE